jgi:beta-galactosidase/beta-glucuronidase
MNKKSLIAAVLSACVCAQPSAQTSWKPTNMSLPTRWSKDVSPLNTLPEYPRPQMVRANWESLNGLWDYAVTDSTTYRPDQFDGKILVPYPLESALSGVKRVLQPDQRLWYQRSFSIGEKQKDKRFLLHFGAVDYQATVYVNGKEMGRHTGGYQEFTVDITAAVQKGGNELMVAVTDPTDKGNNPKGKQVLTPQGIMYTPTSGIWQTVWMETVPEVYIKKLHFTPDVDNSSLTLQVSCSGNSNGYTIRAEARSGDKEVGATTGLQDVLLRLPVKDVHLWSPDDPFIYDLTMMLLKNGKVIDTVGSYFGMRKIQVKKDSLGQERIFLNNKYTFNLGVLDQGFWPDGIYTAPTDAALKWDIEAIKGMGFNTIRKHIKIEPARWYYWCDRLGMLVWQDMPYPANLSDEAKMEFEKENEANISELYNYPSIVCWVLFNEGWNSYDQERLTSWVKRKDPSRIVDGHTGENYDRNSPRDPSQKWIDADMTDVHDYPGPGIAPYLPGKAKVLGEWGGVRVPTPGHQWDPSKGWGYIQSSSAEFAKKYAFMIRHLKLFEEEGLSASIYTQPFDVEIEENGLITYDREVFKIPMETMKKLNSLMFK